MYIQYDKRLCCHDLLCTRIFTILSVVIATLTYIQCQIHNLRQVNEFHAEWITDGIGVDKRNSILSNSLYYKGRECVRRTKILIRCQLAKVLRTYTARSKCHTGSVGSVTMTKLVQVRVPTRH